MKRDRRGVAAMFDALMFLAVAAVVSVALVGAFSVAPAAQDRVVQEKVEAAHLALLRSTLPSGLGNNVTVMELAAAELMNGPSNSTLAGASEAFPILLPGMGFQWEVRCGDRSMMASSSVPPSRTDIYCSQVEAGMPWGQVTYRLQAWTL